MKKVYILSKGDSLLLLASNFKVIYEALKFYESLIPFHGFKSYSWFTHKFQFTDQVAVPTKRQWHFVVSTRVIQSKFIPAMVDQII